MFSLTCTVPATIKAITRQEAKDQCRVEAAFTTDDTYFDGLISAAQKHVEKITGRCLTTAQWLMCMDCFPGQSTVLPYDHQPLVVSPPFFSLPIAPILKDPRAIIIPLAPLVSVQSIITVDENAASATFDDDNYLVDTYSEPGRVVLKRSSEWPKPAAGLAAANGVQVAFTVGYASLSALTAARAAMIAAEALVAAATAQTLAAAQSALAAAQVAVTAAETAEITAIPDDLRAAVKLLVEHFYNNRGVTTTQAMKNVPMAFDSLVANYRMWQRDT